MENVRVSGFATQGRGEIVSLDFSRLTISYRQQLPNGNLAPPLERSWNFAMDNDGPFSPGQDPGPESIDTPCDGGLGVPGDTGAVIDVFVEIDSIPGESKDQAFQDAVEPTAQSLGFGRTGGNAGRFCSGGLALAKFIDRASPLLFEALVTRDVIADVTVTFRRAGQGQFVFLTWTFDDVRVDKLGGAPDGEGVALTFDAMRVDYRRQNPNGSPGPTQTMTWDFITNAP